MQSQFRPLCKPFCISSQVRSGNVAKEIISFSNYILLTVYIYSSIHDGMNLTCDTLFALLADATRRRIMALLARAGELCVCEIVGALQLAQPRVSSHLALLRKAGLVKARKEGLWVHYSPHPDMPAWARDVIKGLRTGSRDVAPYREDAERLSQIRRPAPASERN